MSAASASVEAAGQANAANPPGAPQVAVAGELSVADANLPAPQPEDAKEAMARVNAALTGQLAEAQKAWNAAVAKGNALDAQVDVLQKQVIAERATAAANAKKANNRLCIIAALVVGGALSVLAALSLAAGLYFTLPKLEYGAAGLGLGGAAAFFAATQVGTAHFNILAMAVLIGGMGALVYTVWNSVAGASTLQTKARGLTPCLGPSATWPVKWRQTPRLERKNSGSGWAWNSMPRTRPWSPTGTNWRRFSQGNPRPQRRRPFRPPRRR